MARSKTTIEELGGSWLFGIWVVSEMVCSASGRPCIVARMLFEKSMTSGLIAAPSSINE